MPDKQLKSRLFFLLYVFLLVYALVWARFGYVAGHARPGAHVLQWVIIGALACVAVRAWVVLGGHARPFLSWVWLAVDLGVITAIVWLTGGVRSEAALAYVIPVLTGAVALRPQRVLLRGLAAGALYVFACLPLTAPAEWDWLTTRLIFFGTFVALATLYAVTQRRQQADLTELREQLALAHYRSELSQELHDGVQHYLVAAVCRLELAGKLGQKDPARGLQMAVGVRHTILQAADELRYLVRRLRSPKLERHGFVEALREHLALYADHVPFNINVQVTAEPVSLPPEVEQVALRIVQEALTNAEKHAGPTEVAVTLSLTEAALHAVVQDDGAGFDVAAVPADPPPGEGLGLAGMRHRAQSVGGRLELQSHPGEGCRLSFRIPLQEDSHE